MTQPEMQELRSEDAYDADELGQYRPVSGLAVAALLLGAASPAAFISPLLLAVPLVGAAVALIATAKIRSSHGGMTGINLARTGLVLAVLFGVASATRLVVRDSLMQRKAEVPGVAWRVNVESAESQA